MTRKLRAIVILTIASLVGILLLQVYFGVQVYQQYRSALEREVDQTLKAAIISADGHRIDQINKLFAQDIRNPELVTLSLKMEEEEPKIFLSDPETGDIYVSIRFREAIDSSKITEQLQEEMIKYNRNFLEEGSVMYWTDKIGEKLAKYSDSIQISKAFLLKEIGKELDTLGIQSGFEVVFHQDTSATKDDDGFALGAHAAPVKIDGYDSATILLDTPGREVLRRSGFIYLMTVVILLLIVASFLVLLRFVRRQKRLSQLKDDFIDNVTHELLTPITTLRLALDALRQDTSMTPNRYLDVSQQQTQRIANVVDHVLRVSFVDEAQAGLHFEDTSINALITEAIEYYQVTTQKPLRIKASLAVNYTLRTDAKHLLNVIYNLIGNAIKYSPESGAVLNITAERKLETLHLNITDNGPGIPKGEQQSIFEKFHRVPNGDTHEVSGLGIGLYYAKGIMKQLGGQLKLKRSSPAGSTFSIILPYPKNQ